MARHKKIKEYIVNDTTRRSTLTKRGNNLMKKVSEISTLCDIEACVIVYGGDLPVPMMWPDDRYKVTALLRRFRDMPETERRKRTMNHQSYLRDRKQKAVEQRKKLERKDHDDRLLDLFWECIEKGKAWASCRLRALAMEDPNFVHEFNRFTHRKMTVISDRIRRLEEGSAMGTSGAAAASTSSLEEPRDFDFYSNINFQLRDMRNVGGTSLRRDMSLFGASNLQFLLPQEQPDLAAFGAIPRPFMTDSQGTVGRSFPSSLPPGMGRVDGVIHALPINLVQQAPMGTSGAAATTATPSSTMREGDNFLQEPRNLDFYRKTINFQLHGNRNVDVPSSSEPDMSPFGAINPFLAPTQEQPDAAFGQYPATPLPYIWSTVGSFPIALPPNMEVVSGATEN